MSFRAKSIPLSGASGESLTQTLDVGLIGYCQGNKRPRTTAETYSDKLHRKVGVGPEISASGPSWVCSLPCGMRMNSQP